MWVRFPPEPLSLHSNWNEGFFNMSDEQKYYTYVLQNHLGEFYKGFTSDLKKRLQEHNAGLTKSIRNKGPWQIVYFEEFLIKEDAIKREKYFKTAAGRRFLKAKVKGTEINARPTS